jgi:Ca2+-binding EF-hand superfamily protein
MTAGTFHPHNRYLSEFGGPVPDKTGAKLRWTPTKMVSFRDLEALFAELDADKNGFLDEVEIGQAAERLGFPFKSPAELRAAFSKLDTDGDGRVREEEFISWWNSHLEDDLLWSKIHADIKVTPDWEG